MRTGPVETKVKAAAAGAVSGVALIELALWIVETRLVGEPMPEPGRSLLVASVPGVVAFLAGFWARHTHRTDLAARRHSPYTTRKK